MKIAIASRTHQGEVRDHNEDDFLVYQDLSNKQRLMPDFAVGRPFSLGQDGTLLVIADGMGGMNAGEVASAKAIEGIEQFMESNGRGVPLKKVKETLFGAIKYANKNIAQHGKENPETQGMGTTLIIAWLRDEKVHCAWVGDSRLYLSRPGQPLLPISKDHSLVQEWVDQGKISYEDAFFDPQNHIVTQSLGDGGQPIYPDYKFFTPKVGDRILVCSDGLNSMIEDKDIDTLVSPPEQTAVVVTNNLVKAARDAGGYDNITIIVAEMREVTPTDILPGEFVVPLPPPIQGQGMIIPEEEGKKKSYDSIFRAFEKRDRTKNMLLFFLVILLVVVIVFAFGSGVKKILGLGGKKSPDLDYVVNTDSLEKRKRIDSLRAVYAEENRIRDSINRANKLPDQLELNAESTRRQEGFRSPRNPINIEGGDIEDAFNQDNDPDGPTIIDSASLRMGLERISNEIFDPHLSDSSKYNDEEKKIPPPSIDSGGNDKRPPDVSDLPGGSTPPPSDTIKIK